jgi:sec-independent protein translocase protein TatB
MLGFAWSEIFLIGAVALVVIGPKDLPRVMRTMGQWSRKLRMLAGDFQRHFDDMVRQADLDEVKRQAESAMNVDDIKRDVETAVDVSGLHKSMTLDEATAAAELPVVPGAAAPSAAAPAPEPVPPAESHPTSSAEAVHVPPPEAIHAPAPGVSPHPASDAAHEPTP